MNSNTPTPGPNEQRPLRWMDVTLLLATLGACAVALSPNPADPDLWGHVQYGRDAIEEGLPATTTYSFTANGYRWINHENLSELILAVGIDSIGPVGMLRAKCVLGVLIILVVMWQAKRQGTARLTMSIVGMLVAVNLTYFWSMRPQVMSITCYTLLLILLSLAFRGWEGSCRIPWFDRNDDVPPLDRHAAAKRLTWLWAVIPLFVVWTNSHGGFVAGFCIFTAYLAFRSLEALLTFGRDSGPLLTRMGLIGVAGGMATLINPYGPELQYWLLQSLGSPRPEIVEWHAPDLTSTVMMPLWLIMIVWLASMLMTRRSRDFTHTAILMLTLWQSLEHVRHIPFFAVPFGFWAAIHIDSVLTRFRITSHARTFGHDLPPKMKAGFVGLLLIAFALLGYRLSNRLSDVPVARDEYPVDAFQFIADHDLRGRMVVTYNWAQYAIAAFGTREEHPIRVSFDGRFRTCYSQEVVDMNFDFILGNLEPRYRETATFDDELVLQHGSPDLVLLNRRQPHSVNVMFRNRDQWCLLYQDKICQLWGRSQKYDSASHEYYLPGDQRLISEEEPEGTVTWPAFPVPPIESTTLAIAQGTTR